MTATGLQTTTTATATANNTTINDVLQSHHLPDQCQSWACNSCDTLFDTGKSHGKHVKEPWHIYNVKRQIASLPPISLATFKHQVQTEFEPVDNLFIENATEDEDQEVASSDQCLFCPQRFDDDTDDFERAIEHMSMIHGLFIQDQAMISDLESFLGYLATVVRKWHECLYCGTARNSTLAIQSHMRDRGHCKLNLEREPELLEFWEKRSSFEDGTPVDVVRPGSVSGNQLVLSPRKKSGPREARKRPSGSTRRRETRIALRNRAEQSALTPLPKERGCRQLSRRDEMGIQSLGPQQRHALVLAVKRSQKEEAVASRASEWSYARKANKQKHDQAHGPLSWAKGGMHNLLPR